MHPPVTVVIYPHSARPRYADRMENAEYILEQKLARLDQRIAERREVLYVSQNSLTDLDDAANDPELVALHNERERLRAEQSRKTS